MKDSHMEYDDNLSLFRLELINLLGVEFVKAKLFANGDIDIAPNWKDNLVQAFISAAVILITGAITALIAAGVIISMPVITIPISLAGLVIGMEYTSYRKEKKQIEYGHINKLFYHREPEDDLAVIVNNIAGMYQQTIKELAKKDVPILAKQFSKVIIQAMKKDKINNIGELLHSDSLYALFISEKKHISKNKITLEIPDNQKRNCRSAIIKPGIYSERRPHNIYLQPKSRPEKYGLLFFERSVNFKKVLDTDVDYSVLSMEESEKLITKSGFNSNAILSANLNKIEESRGSFRFN